MTTLTATAVGATNEIADVFELATWTPFGSPTATDFGIELATDTRIVFHGTGLGAFDSNFSTTGTITSIDVYEWNGASFVQTATWTISGALNADDLHDAVVNANHAAGDAAFAAAIFGGVDTLTGSTGQDTLIGYGGNDTITGGADNDILGGGAGADSLDGGSGDDILAFAEGAESGDFYDGGSGGETIGDSLVFTGASAGAVSINVTNAAFVNIENIAFGTTDPGCTSVSGTLTGAQFSSINPALIGFKAGIANLLSITDISGSLDISTRIFLNFGADDAVGLTGDSGGNVLTTKATIASTLQGLGGADTLHGGNLADHLYGSTNTADGATDHLYGGNGGDVYNIYELGDIIHELVGDTGTDYAAVQANNYVMAANLESMALFGGAHVATGNGGANTIQGNTDNIGDTLSGVGGADFLLGNAGNDTLIGGLGADNLDGGDGIDTASYVNATVRVIVNLSTATGSAGEANGDGLTNIENLTGSAFDDSLTGDGGANKLIGGAGNDTLNGGIGIDNMIGNGGNDTYYVNNAGDLTTELAAGGGADLVKSSITRTLGNFLENLTLIGNAAIGGTGNSLANAITGNIKANTLNGMNGNDSLNGGAGADTLTGGAGSDTFIFNAALIAANRDTLTDFSVPDDTIKLENGVFVGLGGATGVLAASKFYIGAAAHDSTDRIVYDSANGRLYFDADGNGAGAAIHFATLTPGLALTAADFVVI